MILTSELRNVLLGYMRRGVLTADEAKGMSEDAAAVLGGRTATVLDGETLDTALKCDLSAYDAEFVVLARTLGVRLVTRDGGMLSGAGGSVAWSGYLPSQGLPRQTSGSSVLASRTPSSLGGLSGSAQAWSSCSCVRPVTGLASGKLPPVKSVPDSFVLWNTAPDRSE